MPPELECCLLLPVGHEVMGRASVNIFRAGNEWANILQAPLRQQLQYVRPGPNVSPVLSFPLFFCQVVLRP